MTLWGAFQAYLSEPLDLAEELGEVGNAAAIDDGLNVLHRGDDLLLACLPIRVRVRDVLHRGDARIGGEH